MTQHIPSPADLRSVICQVLAEIAPEADVDAVPGNADIRVELEIDSFDLQTFMEGVAVRTGIEVPEGDYAQVVTIDGCIAYLQARALTPPAPSRTFAPASDIGPGRHSGSTPTEV